MKIVETELPGVFVVEPRKFEDTRGFFVELFHTRKFKEAGIDIAFVQDNFSHSRHATLRGLHYQIQHPQAKLVRAVAGEILDVAVDLRKGSRTFGRSIAVTLSGDNLKQLFIPAGFAHGFCVLSETADVEYKCSDLYYPEHERTLLWSDPALKIDWPVSHALVSDKDQKGVLLRDAENYATL